MSPEEEAAVKEVVKEVALKALDEGILTAVEMMRMAAAEYPNATVTQVANSIEASIPRE